MERRLGRVDGELQRAVRAMIQSKAPVAAAFRTEVEKLGAEKARLEVELASVQQPVNVIALHPKSVARYLTNMTDLARMLREGPPTAEATKIIRELIASVVITPAPKGGYRR